MSKKVLILTAIVLVSSSYAVETDIVHSTWVGGEWGLWAEASNWKSWIVPDNNSWQSFEVTIDSDSIGADEVCIELQQNRTLDKLDCYGNVTIEAKNQHWVEITLRDVNGLTNHGEFMFNGNVEINGNLHNITEENMQVKDKLYVQKGELQNEGFLVVTPGGDLWVQRGFYNSGTLQMFQGACSSQSVFKNSDTGVIKGAGAIHANVAIQNQGAIYSAGCGLMMHAGGLPADGSITNSGVLGNMPNSSLTLSTTDVNNFGTIEVNAGGGVTFDCNLDNEPNGVVKLLGGTLAAKTITQKAGASFEGFGGITGNVAIDPNGIIKLTGPTNIFGDVTIENNAVLKISDGVALITGHTTCNGTIYGNIIPQGGLSGNCKIIISDMVTSNNTEDFYLEGTYNFKNVAVLADTWLWQTDWY